MMHLTSAIALTYGLLALAIASVWLKSDRVWMVLFGSACASAIAHGFLAWPGLLALGVLAGLAYASREAKNGLHRAVLVLLTAVLTLALSMHKLPGFANPQLVTGLQLSAAAPPFTHNLNFDTASAGLLLLAICCVPARSRRDWKAVAGQAPLILGTAVLVMVTGLVLGVVAFDFKLSAYTPVFLLSNLLFTCVTEEAFFRGFLQTHFAAALKRWQAGALIAMVLAAVLFGLAHARGGPMLVGLATLAGLGYGYAYLRSGRIEAAILAHIALNGLHFVAFTYPRML